MNNLRDLLLLTDEGHERRFRDAAAIPGHFGSGAKVVVRCEDPVVFFPHERNLASGDAPVTHR